LLLFITYGFPLNAFSQPALEWVVDRVALGSSFLQAVEYRQMGDDIEAIRLFEGILLTGA